MKLTRHITLFSKARCVLIKSHDSMSLPAVTLSRHAVTSDSEHHYKYQCRTSSQSWHNRRVQTCSSTTSFSKATPTGVIPRQTTQDALFYPAFYPHPARSRPELFTFAQAMLIKPSEAFGATVSKSSVIDCSKITPRPVVAPLLRITVSLKTSPPTTHCLSQWPSQYMKMSSGRQTIGL